MRSNLEDREALIKDLGMEEFLTNEAYSGLRDIDPPVCFSYIYNVFIELYNGCKDMITWADIESWCILRKCELKQYDIDLIRKMSNWADSEISKLRDSGD